MDDWTDELDPQFLATALAVALTREATRGPAAEDLLRPRLVTLSREGERRVRVFGVPTDRQAMLELILREVPACVRADNSEAAAFVFGGWSAAGDSAICASEDPNGHEAVGVVSAHCRTGSRTLQAPLTRTASSGPRIGRFEHVERVRADGALVAVALRAAVA